MRVMERESFVQLVPTRFYLKGVPKNWIGLEAMVLYFISFFEKYF